MGEVIQMPKRCAYEPCGKAIKAHTVNVQRNGKNYHTFCFHEWLKVGSPGKDPAPAA